MKLQARRLEKVIENRSVLSIEQIDLDTGMIVAIVGPVNSGKSLLIRLLAGALPPSGGCVTIDGQDIYKVPTARRHIGVLFENDLLYDRHTIRGNLEFYANLHHLPRKRVDEVLELLGLSDQAQKRIEKLPSSTQRRVAFARTLMPHSPILLLDQPILRTDYDTQALFARLITQAEAEGSAILVTAEDLSWIGKFCTHVVELENGRVLSSQTKEADQKLPQVAPERLTLYKVPARKDDRIVLYDPADLLYATSRDGKTVLRTASEEAITNLTLQDLETRLSGRGFFKAHRAYLVNLQHIKAIIQYTRNSYTLQLDDSQETMISLSKQSEKELQALLDY